MDECCKNCENHFRRNDLTYIFFSKNIDKLCKSCKKRMKYYVGLAEKKLKTIE